MKSIQKLLVLSILLVGITSCEKESILPDHKIPAEIKSYVAAHFPNCNIVRAVEENFELEKYEITLSCNVKLEFDKHKNIIDIDGISKLPDSVIPAPILSYVGANFPSNTITGWETELNIQKIELDNDVTLVFNQKGEFLYIED